MLDSGEIINQLMGGFNVNIAGIQADAMTVWIGFLTIFAILAGAGLIFDILATSDTLGRWRRGKVLDRDYESNVKGFDVVSSSHVKAGIEEDYYEERRSSFKDKDWIT